MTSKDFGPVESEYAFFMHHSTEAENDVAAYSQQLASFGHRDKSISVLDFGCGSGEFTERLLGSLNWPPQSLQLTLLEPLHHQRREAARRLAKFSNHRIAELEKLLIDGQQLFDLIISNHALYYVDDLEETLRRFIDSLSVDGVVVLAIADWANVLMRLWQVGFARLNRPVPYFAAEDVESILEQLAANYEKKAVGYEIRFPDSMENRTKILRFLFSQYLEEISADVLLPEFDRYLTPGDEIVVETQSIHFTIYHSRFRNPDC